ncbi:hypothetical protein F373_gp008 [Bacillus phage SP-10]|nr:hypothetical protein F373_gp008 [Bacillus phage SP-10]BAK52820.1 hypothetical protein [Bacillus phage SP-10]
MKNVDLIIKLLDFDLDADVVVSLGEDVLSDFEVKEGHAEDKITLGE